MSNPWITTFTGRKFYLLEPREEDIVIEDIAHALSNQCRFTGHVREFYSVAQHSVHVSKFSPNYPLAGLMHDASEAYLTDLSSPVKKLTAVGPPYCELEDRIMRAIARKFRFEWPPPQEVHLADGRLALTEKEQLLAPTSWDDDQSSADFRELEVVDFAIPSWIPAVAESVFLSRFKELSR